MNCAFKNIKAFKFRRLLSCASVLILVAAMLSACQKVQDPSEDTNGNPPGLVDEKTEPTETDSTEPSIIMEDDMATVIEEQVNVRSSPSTEANVIAHLEKGDQVKVIRRDKTLGIEWAYTKLGWIPMSALEMNVPQETTDDPESTVPEETQPEETKPAEGNSPETNIKGVITAKELNIRDEASKSGKIVGSYVKGDVVTILETSNGWGRTSKGWISMDYVNTTGETTGNTDNTGNTATGGTTGGSNTTTTGSSKGVVVASELNIRKEATQNSDKVGSYAYGDRVTIQETSNGWGKTDKGWISLSYVYIDGSTGSNSCKGVVSGTQLNVRSGPGTNYDKVASLSYGDRVQVLERIKIGDTTWGCTKSGWISMDYIYVDGTTGDGSGTGTVTGSQLNIRSGPGTNYDSVGSLEKGDTVKILAQFKIGDMTWGCTEKGWVSMSYVDMD